MPMSSDEELRAKCVELAISTGTKRLIDRSRDIYDFVKGDKKRKLPQPEQPPMNVTQEDMARRVVGMIKPT